MSGIYGVARYDGVPVTREMLAPVAAAVSFWGSDGHGQWCGESAGLGHWMLHVTPESVHERMPASIRAAPHLVITADARIDNRDELFDALSVPRPGRAQTPDSSLILLAYERWGADCVKRLLGDFAFAIWNSRSQTMFCARDPFGCRPFVYYHGKQRFLFASDVKGVLAGMESPRLREALLAAYLQMKTYHAEKKLTFFEEIVKLEPAHTATLSAGGLQISRYWRPEEVPEMQTRSIPDYAAELRFLFGNAVEARVRTPFPVGSHLSGGMDSSSISIAASRALRACGKELAAFSWSPPPQAGSGNEGEYATVKAVCRQEKLICEYVPATVASFIATFQRDFTVEPMAMMAREENVQVRAESRRLRVMLSGWGGDEAVTCRATSSPAEFLQKNQWPELIAALHLRMAVPGDSAWAKTRRTGGILYEFLTLSLPDSLYAPTMGNAFLRHESPCIQSALARHHRQAVKEMRGLAFRRLPNMSANMCRYLEIGHIPMRMEHWAASGARHSVAYHYPMLDKRLVEFALGARPSAHGQTDQRRSIFRLAVAEMLPEVIDWQTVKTETATFRALEREYIQAHLECARSLDFETASAKTLTLVDPARIHKAVQVAAKSGSMKYLSGVREAFGCYSFEE